MQIKEKKIYKTVSNKKLKLELYPTSVNAGFPSPAEDHIDIGLDLNEYLVKHESSTFYIYVQGSSMINSGICDGDLIIVDRSLEPCSNNIVLAVIDGEFTIKKILKKNNTIYLMPDNNNYNPICIDDSMDFQVWGVITHSIHHF